MKSTKRWSTTVEYHRYIAEKAIELDFAFTAWDAGDKSNKTIYKVSSRTWVEDVKNALLGVTLSTNEYENLKKLSVFPNPTTNFIQLKTTQNINYVELFDINGKYIALNYVKNDSKIALPNLKSGIYIIKAIDMRGNLLNHKLIINH